jgi:hypothetical protein
MRTIWKYPVQPTHRFSLDLPKGAIFLHVDRQGDDAMMWFWVDSSAKTEREDFAVVGTGQPTPDDAEGESWWHLGTFLAHGGAFVWHLFQRTPWSD